MRVVTWFIAFRYFGSRSAKSAVSILGFISILGIVACTVALVVVLSAFNGLENFSRELYNTFDPDLKILPAKGKYASGSDSLYHLLKQLPSVQNLSFVLEEKAYLRKGVREFVAVLKGVDSSFQSVAQLGKSVLYGTINYNPGQAILGIGVAYHLGVSAGLDNELFQVYVPRADARNLNRPDKAFSQAMLMTSGIFSIQPEVDEKYCIINIEQLKEWMNLIDGFSAIEVKVKNGHSVKDAQFYLQKTLKGFRILNREEQQEAFFKIMQAEKLVVYLIFSFIALLASFGLMGSMRMLIYEKRSNIFLFRALGLTLSDISSIFRFTGMLIVSTGVAAGLLIGIGIVWLQDIFGLVKLGEGYLVEAYPVELRPMQLLFIAITVLAIGYGTNFAAVLGLPKIVKVSGRLL
ncbi:MAG: ABC transporter permease [Thermaurantimonas sp.]|uniref:ABC transporter permease n=1 Tax=Thermaurantimonas sp. TaxID=2681568 RepID=UPI00391BF902